LYGDDTSNLSTPAEQSGLMLGPDLTLSILQESHSTDVDGAPGEFTGTTINLQDLA